MALEVSDVDNARRFIADHSKDLRYCVEWRKWLAWDGVRWRLDPSGKTPVQRAIAVSDALVTEAQGVKARKWAEKSRESARISAMVSLSSASDSISVVQDDFDIDTMILVCPNGTIDLRTGVLREHRREDMSTKMAGTSLQPEVATPKWTEFIHTVTRGNVDLQKYLQRVVGYMLTGDVSEQVLFFFFGVGSNGKGTFLKTIMEMLGEYAQPAPRGLLEQSHSDDHPTQIASLRKARLAVCSEVEQGRELAEALVKDLTGDDKLAARRMREDFWYFHPTHKVVLQGQHKPIIKGSDDGIWRRVQSMPWLARFKANSVSSDLGDDSMRVEREYSYYSKHLKAELPGILAWAVEGCLEWQKNRLSPPAIILESIREYRREMFNVPDWMHERVEYVVDSVVSRAELREDYLVWASEKNCPPVDERQLIGQMRAHIRERNCNATEIVARVPGSKWPARAWRHLRLADVTVDESAYQPPSLPPNASEQDDFDDVALAGNVGPDTLLPETPSEESDDDGSGTTH